MTLYNTLGVDEKATEEEIKVAYRNKAKQHHTDKGGDHDKMTEITHAYSILKSPTKRERYDRTGLDHDDPFDAKFAELVQRVFMSAVDNKDFERTDLVKEMKNFVNNNKNSQKAEKLKVNARIKKLNKVKGRVTGERIIKVIEGNVYDLTKSLAFMDENITFMEQCMEVLNDCKYKFDEEDKDTAKYWIDFGLKEI